MQFRERYGRLIMGTIVKEAGSYGVREQADLADLDQGFYLKLLDRNRHVLRSFQWQGDNSDCRYLKTVARFYVKDRMAARPKVLPLPEDDIPGDPPDFSIRIDLGKMDSFVQTEFSDRDYRVFRLRFFVGLTARRIAEFPTLELRESGVEAVIRKIVEKLRGHFNSATKPKGGSA